MEYLILLIAQFFGVQPEVIIALLPTLVFIFNMLARFIPDDAEGAAGVARKVFKILGLYVSNRVSSGVTVNDLAQFTLDKEAPKGLPLSVKSPKPNGFISVSPLLTLLVLAFAGSLLAGCTGTSGIEKMKNVTCANQQKVRAAAEFALAVVNQCPNANVTAGGIY